MIRTKFIMMLGLFMLTLQTQSLEAREPSEQHTPLQDIEEAATNICTTIPTEGSGRSVELTGTAKAQLDGVVRKLADLGIGEAGKYKSNDYKGVLQEDLARAIKNSNDCKLTVFKILAPKLLPDLKASLPPSKKSTDLHNPNHENDAGRSETGQSLYGLYQGSCENLSYHVMGLASIHMERSPGGEGVYINFSASGGLDGQASLIGTISANGRLQATGEFTIQGILFNMSVDARISDNRIYGMYNLEPKIFSTMNSQYGRFNVSKS